MNDPIVSIIVPVYKTPVGLLKRFLNSALEQTLQNIEIIAVDDASPDGCPAILDRAAERDGRMMVVHRAVNGRAGMARNDGLNLATGRFLFFADADDFMRPEMCENLVNLADFYSADIVCCSFLLQDANGHSIGRRGLLNRTYHMHLPHHRNSAYNGLTFALWDKLFRRETISDLRFEQYAANIGEDTLYNVAAFCRSRTIITTSYSGYAYTVHASSATGRSAKGFKYLRTLMDSGKDIRRTIEEADGSRVGRKFADLMDLKSFAIGCKWIAEHPKGKKQDAMWLFWKSEFIDKLLKGIGRRKILAAWVRFFCKFRAPTLVYWLAWFACRTAVPLTVFDRARAARFADEPPGGHLLRVSDH